jgi:hypothetical protein
MKYSCVVVFYMYGFDGNTSACTVLEVQKVVRGRKERGYTEEEDVKWNRRRGRFCKRKE